MEGGSFYSAEIPSPGTHTDVAKQDSRGTESPRGTFANTSPFPLLGTWGGALPNSTEEQLAFTRFKNATKAPDQQGAWGIREV